MICRLGAEESRTAVRWMKNVPYEQRNIHNIMYNAGENEAIEFSSYFDALESMKAEILKKDFQVALIAAGAYGLPLVAYIKGLGKQAIHMASNMQILFGIHGKRWDNWPAWAAHFNEYWVYPSENETPNGKNCRRWKLLEIIK